ncbi:hypothetical protein SLEP1_g53808 [Rubroshorea leprosula]|uniref:Uncharacterized protein n=1 Tax=Rubroshorea leprosula TaxID=152421 RepID=A0AAV5MBK6_9ROSI|nr:hypothetical protein SLEP1_g53808 [Rubroshorea leprosula]
MTEVAFALLVIPVIEEALSRFASPLDSRIRPLWNSGDLKKELEKLKDSLKLIEPLLNKADQMQSDEGTRDWLQRLQDAADDLRDLLDEHAYGVHRQKGWIQSQFKKQVHHFLFPSKSMLSKIKEINVCFHRIAQESNFIRLMNYDQNREAPRREADDSFYNFKVLGRDADVSKIESLLDELSQKHHLSGLSIVGMPGVGKTAVARSICVTARENHSSSLVAWVPIRKDLEEMMILRQMLQYLDSHAGGMTDIDPILSHLTPKLENKKILLILDGLCNEEDARWLKEFISRLPQRFKTARISVVITTSNKEVASLMMDTIPWPKYELQKLSDEDCWLIMEENVLRSSSGTSIEDHSRLLLIGKDIAKQCGGLPLVAAVFGKHLGAHIGVNEWSAIRDNKAWHAPHRPEILSHLKKSYDCLPPHLKKCFSFCSIYPKNFKIRRDELVQRWMANGFLSQSTDSKSDKEDVGNQYFSDLVSNYLLEDVDMDECGNMKFCKMHDEVHNLALLSAKYETYIWPDTHAVEESVRHMRVQSDENLQAVPKGVAQRLRSLFLDVNVLHMMPKKSRSLQSLKLTAADANELESSLGRLKYYMKYLDISKSAIERLPKSVSKLYNLQTLRFTDCKSLEKLPSGIKNLVSLRHIYFDDERLVPSSIGKLTSLQTLPLFVVGTGKGRRIEELENLKELRGKLKICKLELVSPSEASKAKLKEKGKLIKLQFVWSKDGANKDMGVLEGLQPHSNLQSLTIENYRGGNWPSWMTSKGSPPSSQLNRLVKLKLIDCDECGDISCLELLPELKILNIKAMPNVRRIGRMSYHQSSSMASSSMASSSMASSSQGGGQSIKPFPALKKLELRNMTQLEEWTGAQGMVVFPCLEELHIQHCPQLRTWCTSSSQGGGQSILPFPALKKLTLREMTNLEGWKTAQGMVVFSHLEELHIGDCSELKTWCASNSQGKGDSITPFPALRKLTLSNMTKLEKWTEAQGMIVFRCLQELHIRDCPELNTWWPSSSQGEGESILPFLALRKLTLIKMTKLEGCKTAQGMVVFSCLEELHIGDCPELKTWCASNSQGRGDSIIPFPALKKLTLSNMTKLEKWTEAEGMVVFPCLEELHIEHCPELKTWWASSIQGEGESILPFPALRKLTLSKMTKLEGWKTEQGMVVFSCLEELHIGDCPELKTWCASNSQGREGSITAFPALRKLNLSNMTKLEKWTEAQGMDMFPCLEELHIEHCPELKKWWASSIQGEGESIPPFPTLRKLTLSNMTKLEKWTEAQGMVVFDCLEELHIRDCPELKTWGEDESAYPKLSMLGIQSCPNLQAIPSGLSNLTSLDINNCPKLMEYAQEGSCKWSSIRHAHRIRINEQIVRSQRSRFFKGMSNPYFSMRSLHTIFYLSKLG